MTRVEATAFFLGQGIPVRLGAFGRSMGPAIRSGDVLIVTPTAARDLRVGDVVLCRLGVHLVAHRIVAIDWGPTFLLRGDRAELEDGWVSPADILGRVGEVERDGRRRSVAYQPLAIAFLRLGRRVRASISKGGKALLGAFRPTMGETP